MNYIVIIHRHLLSHHIVSLLPVIPHNAPPLSLGIHSTHCTVQAEEWALRGVASQAFVIGFRLVEWLRRVRDREASWVMRRVERRLEA